MAACAAALAGFPGAAADDGAALQVLRYETGYDGEGQPLAIPSIDPSGITYHNPTGHVFIADSEIDEVEEVFSVVGANIFEVSLSGDVLFAGYDVTPLGNTEPTGIAYSPFDDRFYMTNDFTRTLTRYVFTPGLGFAAVASVNTLETAGVDDPEDVTVDPATGLIYVLDEGLKLVAVYAYENGAGFVVQQVIDLVATFPAGQAPNLPEGIAFDPESGHLFIVSHYLVDQIMYECTTAGALLVTYELEELDPPAIDMQGLAVAPASALLGGPSWGLLLADGRIDNDADPGERDGAVTLVYVNRPPRLDPIADPLVNEGQDLVVAAAASDGDPEDALSFALVGAAAPGAAIDPVSGTFEWTPAEEHGYGSSLFTVRVTDDATPPLSGSLGFVVSVNEINKPPVLDPIGDLFPQAGGVLSFVAAAADPDLLPALGGGLVASWPFDSVFRSATGVHDGTPAGGIAVWTAPGSSISGGGTLAFDGLDDFVSYDPVSLPGDFTAAAWVMPLNIGAGDTSEAVVFGDLANMNWIRLEDAGVRIKFNDDRKLVPTEPDFVNGTWQHLAVVRNAGIVDVYRDGALVGSLPHAEPFTPELLGRKQPVTGRYQGLMDEVALWDRALDPGEVAQLRAVGAVADAGSIQANALSFSLAGNVPPQATIDPQTGEFSWPADQEGAWTFTVRVEDDHVPPASDEEPVTIVAGPCGNGIADPGEDCATCPRDVPCAAGEECAGGVCQPPVCGNGVVGPGEDCETCPQDVPCATGEECAGGLCQPVCGNGIVNPGEDCATCPQDVPCATGEECAGGACQPICGNAEFDPGENCATCPQDVACPPGTECVNGTCWWICGDGVVNPGEDCETCPQDVPCAAGEECAGGVCQAICGNGVVNPGEDCATCPQDVQCGLGEECVSGVCQPICGDGFVHPGEDCATCPQDVQCATGEECAGGVCRPICGNGVVNPGEDCATCPQDVPCGPGEECAGGVCQPICGNGEVNPGEDCATCPQDVQCATGEECAGGVCQPICGNGVVNPGEDCATCPQDVSCGPGEECAGGVCQPICGNGEVNPGEDCATCPQDVQCATGEECAGGVCQPICGNGEVNPGEDCATCPQDVQCGPGEECAGGVCQPICGNGVVNPGEDCATCPQDVQCGPGEECAGGVCQPICGNGVVNPGEDCATCPQDVQCGPGEECAGGACQPICGNGVVNPGEDCATCPQDVQCGPGEECAGGVCQPICGNGVVDPGESCATCAADVPCPPGSLCTFGECVQGCPWDLNQDGAVGVNDFFGLLEAWGIDPGGPPDFNGDGVVNTTDFLSLLNAWGPCPG